MTSLQFTFGNAISHFSRTEGPKGFLWKFTLAYALCALLVQVVAGYFMAPFYALMFDPSAMSDPDRMDRAVLENMGRMSIGYVVSFLGGIFLWIMFEAASQRRYMRGEGFSLRLGADEGRLFVIGLIWVGIFIVMYIAMILLIAIPVGILAAIASSAGEGAMFFIPLLMLILVPLFMIFALWFLARFSPAAAMTIRDNSIQFGEAWRVSRGKAWTIVGSWIVLLLISMAAMLVLYMVFAVTAVMTLIPQIEEASDDPAAVFGAFASPQFLIPALIFAALYMAISAAMMHIFGGPAALAAKTDPAWSNETAMDATFG